MDVNVVVKLLDAGFTRDDIMKIAGAAQPGSPDNMPVQPQVVPPAPKQEEPAPSIPEPAPQPMEDKISEAIGKAMQPFEQLYNHMAKMANMPSMENVQPKGVEDIVAKFFEGE